MTPQDPLRREDGWEEFRREIERLAGELDRNADWRGDYKAKIAVATMVGVSEALRRLAAARGEPEIDVERLARARAEMQNRYNDLRWCSKTDLCHTKAEGARLAIEDFDSIYDGQTDAEFAAEEAVDVERLLAAIHELPENAPNPNGAELFMYAEGWLDRAEAIRAALPTATEPADDPTNPNAVDSGLVPTLDEAWKAAEAALPEGWRIDSVQLGVLEGAWWARAWPARGGTGAVEHGDTPAAALLALAARLRVARDTRAGEGT